MKFYANEVQLNLRDAGLDCDTTLCSRTVGDLLEKAGDHIKRVHGMKGFSKDFYRKALASMQEGTCSQGEPTEDALCEACEGACLC